MQLKEERALREKWLPRSTAAEKSSKTRSGHMVTSGLSGLSKSCFDGIVSVE